MTIPLGYYLILAGILFAIGLGGALTRKNAIIVLVAIEIMFNAGILNLIAFWHYRHFASVTAQMFAIFAISIAAGARDALHDLPRPGVARRTRRDD